MTETSRGRCGWSGTMRLPILRKLSAGSRLQRVDLLVGITGLSMGANTPWVEPSTDAKGMLSPKAGR